MLSGPGPGVVPSRARPSAVPARGRLLPLLLLLLLALMAAGPARAQLAYTRSSFAGAWTPITPGGGAATITFESTDDATTSLPLPFNFTYVGTTFTTAHYLAVCTNGMAFFSTTSVTAPFSRVNTSLFTSVAPNRTLAPWWDDLNIGAVGFNPPGSVLYQVQGAPGSRTFTVQWTNVSAWFDAFLGQPRQVNFQLVLFEGTNVIEFHYGPTSGSDTNPEESACIGIEDGAGGNNRYIDAVTGSGRTNNGMLTDQAWPTLSYRFTPGAPTPLAGGTYTVGAGGDYPSLTEAVADLNHHGIAGAVTLLLTDAVYDSPNNLFPIMLGPVTGASAVNTITIRPAAGRATLRAPGAPAGSCGNQASTTALGASSEPALGLVGADYVTIRDLDLATLPAGDVDRGLLVMNSSATDGAQNNTFDGLSVRLSRTNPGSIGVQQLAVTTPTSAAGANSNNHYFNFDVANVAAGVYFKGGLAVPDLGTQLGTRYGGVTTIGGASPGDIANGTDLTWGVRAAGQSGLKVFDCTIRNITGGGAGTVDGLWLDNSGALTTNLGDSDLHGNRIHGLDNSAAGAGAVSGVRLNLTANAATGAHLYNNFVYDLNSAGTATATRALAGLRLQDGGGGAGATFNVDFNSVRLAPTGLSGSNACLEIGTASGPLLRVRNNILANASADQFGAARHYAWVTPTATVGPAGSLSDYNDLWVAPAANGFTGLTNATDRATLADWRAATGADSHSLAADPLFAGPTDLHIVPPGLVIPPVSNAGTPLATVTDDIDGQPGHRATTPDIGADEFETYHLVVTPGPGIASISITPDRPEYNPGTVVRLRATLLPCYVFAAWGGDAAGVVDSIDVVMDADRTITAGAAPAGPVPVTTSAGPGGTITPAGVIPVACGDSLVVRVAGDSCHVVADLRVDGVSVGALSSYTLRDVTTAHTIAASFALAQTPAVVAAPSPGGVLSPLHPALLLPVTLARCDTAAIKGYSVTLRVSPELTVTGGAAAITEGPFLSSGGGTYFNAREDSAGVFTVDCVVLGPACGSPLSDGTLFSLPLGTGAPGDTGRVTITRLRLRDCDNDSLAGLPGPPAALRVDTAGPLVQVTFPNGGEFLPAGATRNLTWTATDPSGVGSVDLAVSLDGGVTWPYTPGSGLPNSGSFAWVVPDTASTTARLRVTAHDGEGNSAADLSDADFALGRWTITATAGPGGALAPAGVVALLDDATQAFTVTPDSCHHVADVRVDGVSVGPVGAYTFSHVTAHHTLAATFARNRHVILATAGPGGTIAPAGSDTVDCGSDLTFTITPDACHHLVDVRVDSVSVGPVSSYTFTDVRAPHTITATFALDRHVLTASAGPHGFITPSGADTVDCGATRGYAITPDSCYAVADVRVDGVSVGTVTAWTFTNIAADHTIESTFSIRRYALTATAGPGGAVTHAGLDSAACGETRAYVITPDPCRHILDVRVDGVSVGAVAAWTFTDIHADHTLEATFALDRHVILATAGPGGTIAPAGPDTVDCGADRTFTITPDACHHLVDVVVDSLSVGPVSSYTFTHVTGPHTISATFAVDRHVLTASAGPHGAVTPAGADTVDCGSSRTYAITPDSCYVVADVRVDSVSVGPVTAWTFTHITADHTLAATFAPARYVITASAGPGGAIAPVGADTVACGADALYLITPAPCHHVQEVRVDGVPVGAPTSYAFTDIHADHAIEAVFARDTFEITASAGPGGSVTPAGAVLVPCGGDTTFTFVADPGHALADLRVDDVSVGAPGSYTFTNVLAPHTLEAIFMVVTPLAVIDAVSPAAALCPAHPSVRVPVTLTRPDSVALKGFSVEFVLSPNLAAVGGAAGITEGTFLSAAGATVFQVTDNGGGRYTADGVVLGPSCGSPLTAGTLFEVEVTSSDTTGGGTVTLTRARLRDCDNEPRSAALGATAAVTIDDAPPTVTLAAPNAGETWAWGAARAITWSAGDAFGVPAVDLALSLDGGLSFPHVIATGVPNTGSYAWTVPHLPTTHARVRVTAHDACAHAAADGSDADFTLTEWTITATAGPHGTLAPAGVTAVPEGGAQGYTLTPAPGYVVQDVKVDGVSVGAPPAYTFTNVTASHTIHVTFSDGAPPTCAVLFPNGGDTLIVGNSYALLWSATDNDGVTCVDLALSRHGVAGPWETLATCLPNSGSFAWTVAGAVTTHARLRVTAHDPTGNSGEDLSDADWTIDAPVSAALEPPLDAFRLGPVVPNPARGVVRLVLEVPAAARVRVAVYDVSGREVALLADREFAPGRYETAWDGRGHSGPAAAGLYFVRATGAGLGTGLVRRFVLAR